MELFFDTAISWPMLSKSNVFPFYDAISQVFAMHTPELPDLMQVTSRLAHNNQRVSSLLDTLAGSIEALASAASQRAWQEVLRITEEIKLHGAGFDFGSVSEAADDLIRTLPAGNETETLRRVVRLIGATGRIRRTTGSPTK